MLPIHLSAVIFIIVVGGIYFSYTKHGFIKQKMNNCFLKSLKIKTLVNSLYHIKDINAVLNAENFFIWIYLPDAQTFTPLIGEPLVEGGIIFKDAVTMVHPDDLQSALDLLDNLLKGEKQEGVVTVRLLNKASNKYHYYECKLAIKYDSKIRRPYIIGVQKEITEKHIQSLELHAVQNSLNSALKEAEIIISNIKSGLAYITTDYMVQWEYISTNSPHLVYESYQKGELCFKSAYGRETPCENCLLQSVMEKKQIGRKIFNLPNGRDIEVSANPIILPSNKIEGIVIRVDDITDRLKMINSLKQAKEKAEESDRLKSAFIANMTHEIRTPLNAITGFSDLLIHTSNPEEQALFAEVIATNNSLLLQLINDVISISKFDSSMTEFGQEEINLTDLFNEVIATSQISIKEKVSLVCNLPHERFMFKANPEHLSLVISHFLSNAIKFTHKGKITVGYNEDNDGVYCYVTDTGIGIKEEDQSRIFNRFEKVNSFIQGGGLGLSICKIIAEAYQGKIGVESELDKGSTFWIWLPGEVNV